MNANHHTPVVVHLTIDDEAWLRERRKERGHSRPTNGPAREDELLKEEKARHEKKASLLDIVARFRRAARFDQAGLSRK